MKHFVFYPKAGWHQIDEEEIHELCLDLNNNPEAINVAGGVKLISMGDDANEKEILDGPIRYIVADTFDKTQPNDQ